MESWKEIAAYLGRDVTTVRRWEKGKGLPVHQRVHNKLGSVYADTPELDARRSTRAPTPAIDASYTRAELEPIRRWRPYARTVAAVAALALVLAAAAQERSNIMQYLKVHPFFDLLRGDPRFAGICAGRISHLEDHC